MWARDGGSKGGGELMNQQLKKYVPVLHGGLAAGRGNGGSKGGGGPGAV